MHLLAPAIGAFVPLLHFALFHDYNLSLWDEGFLWYGAQRVLVGEVPIRDFMAYDPARYVWSASWMWLLGSDSILALRASNAVLQALVGAACCFAIFRKAPYSSTPLVISLAATIFLITYPDFKIADFVAPVILWFALRRFFADSSVRALALAGLAVGFAGVIGRNHGVYGFMALGLALTHSVWTGERRVELRQGLVLALSIAAGYLPMILAAALIPGFYDAMFTSVKGLFERGTTNLGLPWPRFWWVRFPECVFRRT